MTYLGLLPMDLKRLLLQYYDRRVHCLLKGIPDMLPLVRHCGTTQVCAYAIEYGMMPLLSWARTKGYSTYSVLDLALRSTGNIDAIVWYLNTHDIDTHWGQISCLAYTAGYTSNTNLIAVLMTYTKITYHKNNESCVTR